MPSQGLGSNDFRHICSARGVAPTAQQHQYAMAMEWISCLLASLAFATEPHLTRGRAERWTAARPSWSLMDFGNPTDRDEPVHSVGTMYSTSRTALARGRARIRGDRFTPWDAVTSRCGWISDCVKECQAEFFETRGRVQAVDESALNDSERGECEGT